MAEKILTGTDRAKELGFENFRAFLADLMRRGGFVGTGKISAETVRARIDFGRWLADCPCGGADYVDPDDPVFICTSCGNESHGGDFLTVVFPQDRKAIEAEVLKRPVITRVNMQPTQAQMYPIAMPLGLERSWKPGENVRDVEKARKDAEARLKKEARK